MKTAALLQTDPAFYQNAEDGTGIEYAEPVLRTLGPSDIGAMLELQRNSGDGQVVQRTESALRAHFNKAGHTAIGLFAGERLVGQALIANRTVASESLSLAFAGATARSSLGSRDFSCSTLSGVLVSPEMRGRNLMGRLMDHWTEAATQAGCDLLHARVRVGNVASWKNFLKQGLKITDIGPSPDDAAYTIFSMYRPLSETKFVTDANDVQTVRAGAVETIGRNLAGGYIGAGWNEAEGTVRMVRFKGLHP